MKFLLLLLSFTCFAGENSFDRMAVVGSTISVAGNCPQGYLTNDASAVSRITYSKLFSQIGTTYGAGNGTTTFNLPNMAPNVVKLLSGTGTYVPSGGTRYIRIRMCGGGSGGAGNSNSGTNNNYSSTGGGNTTLGDIIAYGGNAVSTHYGSAQVSGVLGAVAKGSVFYGQSGGSMTGYNASGSSAGGSGGSSIFGGGAQGATNSNGSYAAQANSCAGGGGASGASYTAYSYGGTGGNGGGGVDAIYYNPGSLAYSVGIAGAGGAGNNWNGAAGGSGYIEITEYNLLGNCIKY